MAYIAYRDGGIDPRCSHWGAIDAVRSWRAGDVDLVSILNLDLVYDLTVEDQRNTTKTGFETRFNLRL